MPENQLIMCRSLPRHAHCTVRCQCQQSHVSMDGDACCCWPGCGVSISVPRALSGKRLIALGLPLWSVYADVRLFVCSKCYNYAQKPPTAVRTVMQACADMQESGTWLTWYEQRWLALADALRWHYRECSDMSLGRALLLFRTL